MLCHRLSAGIAILQRDATFSDTSQAFCNLPAAVVGPQSECRVQSIPGPEITASWSAPATAVMGLGRPLSGNARTVTVPLVQPGTMFGERLHQVDVRAMKDITLHRQVRMQLQFDVYNLLNGNTVIAQNNTYGANWQRPLAILAGRLFKFGALLRF